MSEIKALGKLRGLPFHGTNGFGTCVTASKETISSIADEIEAEIAERFMELPVDADGVPIHMGDSVEGELLFDNATVRGTVCAYHIHDDDEPGTVYVRVKPAKDTWTIKELQFKRCRHVKPRTIEDVLADFSAKVLNSGHQWGLDSQDAIGKCAAEIRELTEVDR